MSGEVVRVHHVMKHEFDTIDGMATIADALRRMKHVETKCLVVDKRDDDDEYGILLISDIARQVLGQDRSPGRVNVYEVMAKPVISVDPEMDIRYCARLFTRFQLSRAPVVESGKVVGIVSMTDLVLKGLCRDL
ncbi:MAG: CBS domain-containing protein [Rhodocyclaceae bacterium]|nr:CBS domain-containing protein [Rhodocyclaceae bacterium]MCB1928106.1 CBS domain-containing protein [Rhodocyclaceae bacterium]MCP5236328.1 CBS domain-containing protein [Zoogloeaceae bacterium]